MKSMGNIRRKKNYKCFTSNVMLVQFLLIFAILPLLPAILGGISGDFSFWGIFSCCCITVAVTIASIITMVLTKYRIDCNGITVDVARKSKQLIPWNKINSVEMTRIHRYGEHFVELKSDDITISFNTTFTIIKAIKEFSKDCDSFHKLFSERVEQAWQTGSATNPTIIEQIPDAQETKIFITDKERLALGGTGFHEIQYCKKDLPIKKLLYWKNVNHWATDSLYVEALTAADKFFNEYYDKIFGQFGGLDYFGINYFTKEQTEKILSDLKYQDLPNINILIDWLEVCVSSYSGFYFLGV